MQQAAEDVTAWTGILTLRLRTLAQVLPRVMWTDACRRVAQRRGLAKGDPKEAVQAEANALDTAPQLLALIAELVAAKLSGEWSGLYHSGTLSAEEKAFWAAWGVDPARLRKEAEKERKAKSKGKGQGKDDDEPTPQEEQAEREDLADRLTAQAAPTPRKKKGGQ
jgi:hypothetical protein